MFEMSKFMSEYQMTIEAINFKGTDLRTGQKIIGTFYYPRLDGKTLENLCKYGFHIEEIGESTRAVGTVNLAEIFGNFVEEGGLE